MELAFLKRVLGRQMELVLVTAVIIPAYLIQFLVPHKIIALNFFFIPTVIAAFTLGLRSGGLTALLSFLIVSIYAVAAPERFLFQATPLLLALDLMVWGGFLGLTSIAIGWLCDERRRQLHEIRSAYVGILEILARFLESADHYTKSHSMRVAKLSTALASELGMSPDEIDDVRAGAILHDIGKTESVELVQRASALDAAEQRQVASHTVQGAELVRTVGTILKEAVPIVLYHHHYYGGRPGQEGPVGDEIPLGARIVAVADSYDAIVTDRPYRKGRAPWQAIAEIEACAGTQFDPNVVEAFKRVVAAESAEPEREFEALPAVCD